MTYSLGTVSKALLKKVHPKLAIVVELAITLTRQDFKVNEGLRTLERQRWLYASGRTRPGPKVTKTMKSKHLAQADGYSHAVDLLPYPFKGWKDVKGFDEIKIAMLEAARRLDTPLRTFAWDSPHFELA